MTAPGSYNANVVLSADVNPYQQAMGAAVQSTDQVTGSVNRLGQAYQSTKSKLSGRMLSFDRTAIATLAAGTAAAALYQKQLSSLAASTAVTGQSMGTLRKSLDNTFVNLPVARGQLVALATTINTLGVTSSRDIGALTNTFTKLSAATGGSAEGLASSMLAFTQAMGDKSVANVNAMSNSLVNLARNEGLASESILSFANAIAPIARVAGITENQVLGLSTAFSKAGADGYVAANTFNNMLENITQLSATGSPELSKYANVLGLTVQQFNNLPRAQAVAQLFEAINRQGNQGISTLNQLGINGVRSIRALQSVVSEGDLGALAGGGSTTNGALDKASGAAFNNLADSLAVTRNEMTQYGTYIGQYVIGPTNAAVQAFNHLVNALQIFRPLLAAPLLAAGIAGTALGPILHAAAPLVMGRWLARGPVGRGLRYGFGMGRLQGDPERMAAYSEQAEQRLFMTNQRRIQRGLEPISNTDPARMGPFQRMFYNPAATLGNRVSGVIPQNQGDLASGLRGFRNYAITSPQRAISWFAGANRDWYRNTYGDSDTIPGTGMRGFFRGMTGTPGGFGTPGLDRVMRNIGRPFSREGFTAARSFFRSGSQLTEEEQGVAARVRSGAITTESAEFKSALQSMTLRLQNQAKAITDNLIAEGKSTKAATALAEQTGIAARSMAELSGAAIKASISAFGATARALPGSALVRGAAVGAGRFAGGLAKDLFASPLGAVLTGTLAYGAVSHYNAGQEHERENMISQFLNPMAKYNVQLGIASDNLANFSNKVQDATEAAQKSFQPTTFGQVGQNLSTLAATAPSSPLNGVWNAVAQSKGNKVANATQVLSTMPISDPRQLAAVAQDMIAAGLDQQTVSQVLAQYNAGGRNRITGLGNRLNYGNLSRQVISTEGQGTNWSWASARGSLSGQEGPSILRAINPVRGWQAIGGLFGIGNGPSPRDLDAANQSTRGAQTIGTTLTGIQSAYQSEIQSRGAGVATANRLQRGFGFLGGLIPTATESGFRGASTREALARGLNTLIGGGAYNSLMDVIGSAKGQRNASMQTVGANTQVQQQGIINILEQTKKGRQFLDKAATSMGLSGRDEIDPNKFETYVRGAQNGGSDFDRLLRNRQLVGPLGGFASRSTTVQNALGTMSQDPGTQNRAIKQLADEAMKTSHGFVGAQAALQKLSDGVGGTGTVMGALAIAAKGVIARMQAFQMPSLSRAGQMGVAVRQYQAAANADPNSADYQKNLDAAQEAYEQQKESARQNLISIYNTLVSYQRQMHDSNEDYNTSVARSNKAFRQQQIYAEQDFGRQMYRVHRDYQRNLKNQAATAAQSIYDPYQRQYSKPTASGGTLLENLGVENDMLRRQKKELDALHKMGLSTEAIQTLSLADPNNSQQLDRLFLEAKSDPGLIIALNAQTARRVKLTKKLTQSDFNLQFAQANQNYTQGLKDAEKDYDRARGRARKAQSLALNQMAEDFSRAMRRSARDLKTSMTELSGDMGTWYSRVMRLTHGAIAKYAPQAADIIDKQLGKLAKKYPMLFDANYKPKPVEVHITTTAAGGPSYGPNAANPGTRGDQIDQGGTTTVDLSTVFGTPGSGVATGHAAGGISTYEHLARISERNQPEAIIPLDARGQRFMLGMYNAVASAVKHQSPMYGVGGATTVNKTFVDNSTNIAKVEVSAADTREFFAEMKRRQRLSRLTKPAHATA
jgi:TP901 family phage tail tape measure protein